MEEAQYGDALVIKMSNGTCMVHYRPDQEYGDIPSLVDALMAEHHADKSVTGYAMVDGKAMDDELKSAGKAIDDCVVTKKSEIPTGHKAIPTRGTSLDALKDDDYVVSYP